MPVGRGPNSGLPCPWWSPCLVGWLMVGCRLGLIFVFLSFQPIQLLLLHLGKLGLERALLGVVEATVMENGVFICCWCFDSLGGRALFIF